MKIYIFINGILNLPGDAHAWTDRAAAYINGRTPYKGEKFEYFASPLGRRIFQGRHAHDLAAEIAEFGADGDSLVLVGHSNGCDLILRALAILDQADDVPVIDHIHLISGACDADFKRNGLNLEIFARLVSEVTVYIAGQDTHFFHPLWLARQSQKLLSWLGLGYGTLGATGPLNVGVALGEHVHTITQPTYDHSTWFQPAPFEQLMRSITQAPQTATKTG